jgi:hypothetical protein
MGYLRKHLLVKELRINESKVFLPNQVSVGYPKIFNQSSHPLNVLCWWGDSNSYTT